MNVEKELLKATKIKAKQYDDRQEMLAAIARMVNGLNEDTYKKLTDPALDWYEAAVKAMNAKKSVPDFDEVEAVEEPPRDPDEDDEPAEDEEGDEDAPDDSASSEAAEGDQGGEEAQETEQEAAATEPADADGEPDLSDVEPEPEPEATGPKPKKKTGRPKKARPPRAPTRYDNLVGEKNRYGKYAGTKLDDVLKMLEKGCTQAEIKAAVGDTKYNLIRWLRQEGHLIEKDGSKHTLTHRDDVKGNKKKGK